MKKKEVKKKKSMPRTMKQITKNHKVVKGKKENPNHKEDFGYTLKRLLK